MNYDRQQVTTAEGIVQLGQWLQTYGAQAEYVPIGFSFWDETNAGPDQFTFATKDVTWEVTPDELEGPLVGVLKGTLRKAFETRGAPRLVCSDIGRHLSALASFLDCASAQQIRDLAELFIGDLRALTYCTGRKLRYTDEPFYASWQEALDAHITESQLRDQAPAFYHKVSIPIARHQAVRHLDVPEDAKRWQVTYNHLFLRVFEHITRDPTIHRALTQVEDKTLLPWLGDKLHLEPDQIYPALTWLALNSDRAYMEQTRPELCEHLPDNIVQWRSDIADILLTAARSRVANEVAGVAERDFVRTLYGRVSKWNPEPAEAMHHLFFGSIRDIIDVAYATFIAMDSLWHEEPESEWWQRVSIVGHSMGNSMQWEENLTAQAELDDPLVVPLVPKVTVEG